MTTQVQKLIIANSVRNHKILVYELKQGYSISVIHELTSETLLYEEFRHFNNILDLKQVISTRIEARGFLGDFTNLGKNSVN